MELVVGNKPVKISEAIKHEENPFIGDKFVINKGTKTVIAGKTSSVLMDTDTGEVEGVTMLHKFKQVDKEQFVKLFLSEVSTLFELSKTALKVFGYVMSCLPINKATIYFDMKDAMKYCGYSTSKQVYKGLSELIANKIVAMSSKPNLWFINPAIVFNGDRIAFVKEYRLSSTPKQSAIDFPPEPSE